MKDLIITNGLRLLPKDDRDFKMGSLFKRDFVPEGDFIIGSPELLDQGDSDMCTAFATCAASSLQEKKTLEPAYTFAKTKQLMNEKEGWGADLRTACKSHKDFGALEKQHSPYSLDNKDRDFLSNWDNWDSVYDVNAMIHKKKAFLSVEGWMKDTFDSIRLALHTHKTPVITGMLWRPSWVQSSVIPITYEDFGFGHAFIFIGQKKIGNELMLVAQLSNGKQIGDKGLFYFPRTVVNKEATFGNFVFKDLTEKEIEALKNPSLLRRMMSLLRKYFT